MKSRAAHAGDEADKLDEMLADSFPASDPPSFTPVTGNAVSPEDAGTSHAVTGGRLRARVVTAGAVSFLVLTAFAWWRRHRSR